MATSMKPYSLSYEQLLEMISAFQWIPERKCIRLALDCDPGCRDWLTNDPVFCCLNHFTATVDRQAQQGPLSSQTIRFLMVKLAHQYTLLQKIDGDSIITEVNRLVETIGVDLVLIGIENAYATALVRLLRPLAPIEWNKFCDYAERLSWKVSLDLNTARSRPETAAGFRAESLRSEQGIIDNLEEIPLPLARPPRGRGLAHAFETPEFVQHGDAVANGFRNTEQEEEDQDDLSTGLGTPAAGNIGNKSYGWSFKKFGLR